MDLKDTDLRFLGSSLSLRTPPYAMIHFLKRFRMWLKIRKVIQTSSQYHGVGRPAELMFFFYFLRETLA